MAKSGAQKPSLSSTVIPLLRASLGERFSIVKRIKKREHLSLDEGLWLAEQPLSILLGIIEACFEHTPLALRTVMCCSTPVIEEELIARIDRIKERSSGELYLGVERWEGGEAFEKHLALLCRLQEATGAIPLAPSAEEIRLLYREAERERLEGDPDSPALTTERILTLLKAASFRTIPGGSSVEIHHLAVKHGFTVHYTHDLSYLLGGGNAGTQPLYPIECDRESVQMLFERFVSELLDLHEALTPHHSSSKRPSQATHLALWSPWSSEPLTSPRSLLPTPLRALRIIALARILLPTVPFISAPLTLFGAPLASLALTFGANDLGFLAADSQSASTLGIRRYSEGVEVVKWGG